MGALSYTLPEVFASREHLANREKQSGNENKADAHAPKEE